VQQYNPGYPEPQDNSVGKFLWSNFNPASMAYYEMQWRALGGGGFITGRRGLFEITRNKYVQSTYGKISKKTGLIRSKSVYGRHVVFHSPGVFGVQGLFRPMEEVSYKNPWHWARRGMSAIGKGETTGARAVFGKMGAEGLAYKSSAVAKILGGGKEGLGFKLGLGGTRALRLGAAAFTAHSLIAVASGIYNLVGTAAEYGAYTAAEVGGRIRGELGTRFSTNVEEHFFTAQSATERSRAMRVMQEANMGAFQPTYGNEATMMHRTYGQY